MVKGISRQVIVVNSPQQKLFEQAIFILKDDALHSPVTEETLLKEAKRIIHSEGMQKRFLWRYGPVWACGGAVVMGFVWLLSGLL